MFDRFHEAASSLRDVFVEEMSHTEDWRREQIVFFGDALFRQQQQMAYWLVFRFNHPQIIGAGTHQVTFSLGDDLVEKVRYQQARLDLGMVMPGFYCRDTLDNLALLGVSTPATSFFKLGWKGGRPSLIAPTDSEFGLSVCVTEDLRERGAYVVRDYNESLLSTLPNGAQLHLEREGYVSTLLSLEMEGSIRIPFDSHRGSCSDGTLREAVEKMFLLQIPSTPGLPGKLVAGDFDHVAIYQK